MENKVKNLPSVYYGTRRIIVKNESFLNPEHNTKNVFEYGNGVYFSFNKEIADEYITRDSIVEYAKTIGTNKEKQYTAKVGYRHEYKLDITKLRSNYSVLEVNSENIEEVLTETITNYRDNGIKNGYTPNREATIGIMIGKQWDDFWHTFLSTDKNHNNNNNNNNNISLFEQLTSININNIVKDFIPHISNDQQICIHKSTQNFNLPANDPMKYLNGLYLSYIGKFPIIYMEKQKSRKDI